MNVKMLSSPPQREVKPKMRPCKKENYASTTCIRQEVRLECLLPLPILNTLGMMSLFAASAVWKKAEKESELSLLLSSLCQRGFTGGFDEQTTTNQKLNISKYLKIKKQPGVNLDSWLLKSNKLLTNITTVHSRAASLRLHLA